MWWKRLPRLSGAPRPLWRPKPSAVEPEGERGSTPTDNKDDNTETATQVSLYEMQLDEMTRNPEEFYQKNLIPQDLIDLWLERRKRAAKRRSAPWRSFLELPMKKLSQLFERPMPPDDNFLAYNYHYMKNRQLPEPTVRSYHLWGFGVCSVIVGEFSGWNYGLANGGIGGTICASIIATFIYFCVGCMLSELGTALPFSGGAYAYARVAFGPWGGYFVGLAENFEYQLFTGLALVSITDIIAEAGGKSYEDWAPLVWIPLLFITWFIISYPKLFWTTMVFLCMVTLTMLIVFTIYISKHVDFNLLFTVPVDETQWGASVWFPNGYVGILKALPAALWFYTGFEAIACCIEETAEPGRDLPTGLMTSFFTLFTCMFVLVPASCAVPPGPYLIGTSTFPMVTVANALWGPKWKTIVLWGMLIPTFAALLSMVGAFTRQTFALSRAGYVPKFVSITYTSRRVPLLSMVVGSGYAYAGALIVNLWGTGVLSILLALTVFCGVIAYLMGALSYFVLAHRLKNLRRPFKSPMGRAGAVLCAALCVMTIVVFLSVMPEFRISLLIFLAKIFIALFMFVLFGGSYEMTPEELFSLMMKKELVVAPMSGTTTEDVMKAWTSVMADDPNADPLQDPGYTFPQATQPADNDEELATPMSTARTSGASRKSPLPPIQQRSYTASRFNISASQAAQMDSTEVFSQSSSTLNHTSKLSRVSLAALSDEQNRRDKPGLVFRDYNSSRTGTAPGDEGMFKQRSTSTTTGGLRSVAFKETDALSDSGTSTAISAATMPTMGSNTTGQSSTTRRSHSATAGKARHPAMPGAPVRRERVERVVPRPMAEERAEYAGQSTFGVVSEVVSNVPAMASSVARGVARNVARMPEMALNVFQGPQPARDAPPPRGSS